jgi:hypothetical protein
MSHFSLGLHMFDFLHVFGVEKEKEFKGEFIVEFKIALVNV